MPHATSMPATGFQALILCGPGASLSTFTAKPEDFPKAIIPIANRPMIWYALDYCYRMGITDIFVVTPPASEKAITESMNTNPHLTSLPTPRPDIIAPKALTHESGTADILRQPEVRKVLTGDFVVLPCDIVSELPGESLLEAWMIQQDDLDGATTDAPRASRPRPRKSGLGVWYPTKGEQAFKGEETDFVLTSAPARPSSSSPHQQQNQQQQLVVPAPAHSIRGRLEHVMYAMPADTLNDIVEAQPGQDKHLPLRPGVLRAAGRVRLRTSYRDAHVYVLPRWVLDMVDAVPELDSLSEDVVGSWAKATWQPGFADKLGLKEIFEGSGNDTGRGGDGDNDEVDDKSPTRETAQQKDGGEEDEVDVMSMVSTRATDLSSQLVDEGGESVTAVTAAAGTKRASKRPKLAVPPFLGYIHPQASEGTPPGSAPLVRRVDTAPMLLAVSLRLARLESQEEAGEAASPLAHAAKVAHAAGVAQRSTVTRADCLLDANVRVEERCVVKESVLGANCVVRAGARLTRCLLMDGVTVGEKCQLTDCVVGRRAAIGRDCVLRECRVQDGNAVADGTEAKGEDIMVFEGLDEEADFEGDDDGDDGEEGMDVF